MASKLYNRAAVQRALGPGARHVPMYNEFYEGRLPSFSLAPKRFVTQCGLARGEVPFGTNQLFACDTIPELVGRGVCEGPSAPMPPSNAHAVAGATVKTVTSAPASPALAGKSAYRRQLSAAKRV